MKAKLTFLIIVLILSTQLSAQQDRWENKTDELISRLQQVLKDAPNSERQILKALRDQGFNPVSTAEVRELEHLLRQQQPAAMIKRYLMRLQARNCIPKSETNVSPINSVPITKVNDQPLAAVERAAIGQVLEDFQVNDKDTEMPDYSKMYPEIATNGNGNFVITGGIIAMAISMPSATAAMGMRKA